MEKQEREVKEKKEHEDEEEEDEEERLLGGKSMWICFYILDVGQNRPAVELIVMSKRN